MITPIPASQRYYPNQIARIYLDSIEKIVGAPAMPGFLRECGLERYLEALPPYNLSRQFDFSHFSMLTSGLEEAEAAGTIPTGSTAEAGRLCFKAGLKGLGGVAAFGQAAMGLQVLPSALKIKIGLLSMSTVFTTLSDQRSEVIEYNDHFEYVIHACPMCWGRHANTPICHGAGGLIEEGIFWLIESHIAVVEIQCLACGDNACLFRIEKPE